MLKAKSLVTLLVVAILFAFVGTTMAKEYPGDRAGKKADYLYKKLTLTNDQYTRVYQLLFDYESKMDLQKKGHKKCDDKCKAECKKMQDGVLGDIEKTLNKDQVGKFAGMKDKFFKMSMKKKVKKMKIEKTEGTDKKEVKKDDSKKEVKKETKKETKKEEPKKEVKKEEPKKEKK